MDSQESPQILLDPQGLNSVTLEEIAFDLRRGGEESFRKRFACAFLVLQHGPPSGNEWIDLNTSEASLSLPKDSSNALRTVRVIPMLKSDRNAYGSKITLGRARNNDVIVRAPKISKLHATFYPDGKGGYRVQDMGSLNGTVVNGHRLKKRQRASLHAGDLLSFWRYVFEFVTLDEMIVRLTGKD